MDQLCDGTVNCPEGEDETNATAGRNCSEYQHSQSENIFGV